MLNNLKVRLRKWAEIQHEDFYRLLQWVGFPIETDGANTLVCSASRNGEILACMMAEPVFIVTNFAIKSGINNSDTKLCGNAIDSELAVFGKRAGVGRFLIALPEGAPKQPDEKVLRYVERSVPLTVGDVKQQEQRPKLVGLDHNSTSAWVN